MIEKTNMKYWPVEDSKSKKLPINGIGGSFLENRGDRYHCGVDIYANEGNNVVSIEACEIIETGIFTSPDKVKYWNETYYIIAKILPRNDFCMLIEEGEEEIIEADHDISRTLLYAELGEIFVKKGDIIAAGEKIATVGRVLNNDLIDTNSPEYIQKIKAKNNSCMLHFEIYNSSETLLNNDNYLGGNWFKKKKDIPNNLLDPTEYLENVN